MNTQQPKTKPEKKRSRRKTKRKIGGKYYVNKSNFRNAKEHESEDKETCDKSWKRYATSFKVYAITVPKIHTNDIPVQTQ